MASCLIHKMGKARKLIDLDLERYAGTYGLIKPIFLRWQIAYRKASVYSNRTIPGIINRIRLQRLSEKTGFQIPTKTKIGPGLRLAHTGSIIINPDAVLGSNINLAPGVVIGKANRGPRKGTPIIGNKVWIGTNSVIVGKVEIGEDVLIAPGAFVNTDVPAHSVVIGNPAVIHHREKATEGYINNIVDV